MPPPLCAAVAVVLTTATAVVLLVSNHRDCSGALGFKPSRPQHCSLFQTTATTLVLLVSNHCDRSGGLGFNHHDRDTQGGAYILALHSWLSHLSNQEPRNIPPLCAAIAVVSTTVTAVVLLVSNHRGCSSALGFKPPQPQWCSWFQTTATAAEPLVFDQ